MSGFAWSDSDREEVRKLVNAMGHRYLGDPSSVPGRRAIDAVMDACEPLIEKRMRDAEADRYRDALQRIAEKGDQVGEADDGLPMIFVVSDRGAESCAAIAREALSGDDELPDPADIEAWNSFRVRQELDKREPECERYREALERIAEPPCSLSPSCVDRAGEWLCQGCIAREALSGDDER